MLRSSKIGFTFVLMIASGLGVSRSFGLDLSAEIDPLAQALIDDKQMVGCVVGIVRGGETQVLVYGETEKGSGKAPNGRTVYEIGSATKALTGVLLADAVIAGELNLDDPLQEYLPKSVTVPMKDGKAITLAHLATHTSGLPRLPSNLLPKDPQNPYADYTAEQMAEYLETHELRRAPGECEYSNYGMGLLGHVLAARKKTTYEQLLIDRIAKPLKMTDTRIELTDDQKERLAPPYNAALSPDKNWDIPTLAGAGGLRSTAGDMLKFLQATLEDSEKPFGKAVQLAFEKRHTTPDGMGVGLGWHIARDGITRWHNGMTGGYSSWISVVPQAKLGVVVLSNTATDKTTQLGEQVTRAALGIKAAPPQKRTEAPVDRKVVKQYVGFYEITPEFGLNITEEDGKLSVQATGQSKLPMFAESKSKFFLRVVDAQISFLDVKDGKAGALVLHQNGIDQRAKRVEK